MLTVTITLPGIQETHRPFIQEAVASFNACQTYFRLDVAPPSALATSPTLEWPGCTRDFPADSGPQIIISDLPFTDNWFSHTNGRIAFISTSEWFRILEVPLSLQCYLLMEIGLACSLFIVGQDEWNVPPHNESLGCLYDMCGFKPDILLKLRAGYICADHVNRLLALGASQEAIDAIQRILNLARSYALSRDEDKRRLGAIRSRKVFVVHGRDDQSLEGLRSLLERVWN